MREDGEQVLITAVERRLIGRFAEIPQDAVSSAVRTAHARFDHSRIRDFVPLLVERQARAELAKSVGLARV